MSQHKSNQMLVDIYASLWYDECKETVKFLNLHFDNKQSHNA